MLVHGCGEYLVCSASQRGRLEDRVCAAYVLHPAEVEGLFKAAHHSQLYDGRPLVKPCKTGIHHRLKAVAEYVFAHLVLVSQAAAPSCGEVSQAWTSPSGDHHEAVTTLVSPARSAVRPRAVRLALPTVRRQREATANARESVSQHTHTHTRHIRLVVSRMWLVKTGVCTGLSTRGVTIWSAFWRYHT